MILSGRLGAQQARELWEAAQAAMAGQRGLMVEAGEVEDMDTSVAQILCRAARLGGRFQIGGSSDGFLEALARRGLDRFLIPAVSAAPVAAEAVAASDERPKAALKKTRLLKGRKSRG